MGRYCTRGPRRTPSGHGAPDLGQVPDRHALPIDALHGQATHRLAVDIPDIAPLIGNGYAAGVLAAGLVLAGIHAAVGVAVDHSHCPFSG